MINLHTIHKGPGIQIRALLAPGGLLIITDVLVTSGNGISSSVTQSFLPMTDIEAAQFIRECQA